MISTYQLKSRFQALLRPLAAWLHRSGVTANQVTVTPCVISLALGSVALWQNERKYLFLLISLWCLLRMAANALDGMLAREYGQSSRLGAVLNELGDIVSDIALYLPFALIVGVNAWLVVAIVWLAVCGELIGWLCTRVRGVYGERANHGPMGKSDRALVFGVVALLIGCGVPVEPYLNIVWWCAAALLCVTLYNRARYLATRYRDS